MKHLKDLVFKKLAYQSWLASGIILYELASFGPAQAQIVPDATLPNNSSTPAGCTVCTINGGTTRGRNLFHSFKQFSIPNKGEAFFNNDLQIQNIFSRVTGNFSSNIEGRIRANGSANLFLINPNGIVFGQNASLSLGGSFLATTANAIQFGDRGFFSASMPNSPPPLLTINPSALVFNQSAVSPIQNRSTAPAGSTPLKLPGQPPLSVNLFGLKVSDGRSLLLIGGDILLDQGRLNALKGRVELAGVSGPGTIELEVDANNNFYLRNLPDINERANVSLKNNAQVNINVDRVNVVGLRVPIAQPVQIGGDIAIHARTLSVQNSVLSSGSVGQENGGKIQIDAGAISLDRAQLTASTAGAKPAGNVILDARDNLSIKNASQISSQTCTSNGICGSGNAGMINLQAGNAIEIEGSTISSRSLGAGRGGEIEIKTNSLALTGGTQIESKTSGAGDAGNIVVTVLNFLNLSNSRLSSVAELGGNLGSSGDIKIQTGTLTLNDSAGLLTSSASTTQGKRTGTIDVTTRDSITLGNKSRLSSETLGTVTAGNIILNAGSLSITDSAIRAAASPQSTGDAGNIQVGVRDSVVVSRSAPISPDQFPFPIGLSTSTNGAGQGGQLNVTAGNSVELNGSSIDALPAGLFAATRGTGAAGSITVNTPTLRVNNGAQISADTTSQGAGGNITVTADRLEATNGGQLNTTTSSSGRAGNITANVIHSVTLTGANSGLFASTTERSTGDGGNITIDPRVVLIQDGAKVAVNSDGDGRGGDIRIQAGKLILRDRGSITAATASGEGGDIALNVQDLLLLRQGSEISSKASNAGNGGNVLINNLPGYKGFVVAVPSENSDIRADAFSGNGGNITINSNGVYGFLPKQQGRLDTPFSDINASSALGINGTVTISTLEVDPSRGLAVIPVDLVDPSGLISQQCAPSGKQASSSFVATGQGGLPPNPTGVLGGETVIIRLATLEDHQTGQPTSMQAIPVATKPVPAIVEAQGWVTRSDGVVTLVAEAPATTPKSLWVRVPSCQH